MHEGRCCYWPSQPFRNVMPRNDFKSEMETRSGFITYILIQITIIRNKISSFIRSTYTRAWSSYLHSLGLVQLVEL